MCRLLYASSSTQFRIADLLEPFRRIARDSPEYQGHGWGCAWLENGAWRFYRSIEPVWEDDLRRFASTTVLVAHARSAFRDEGICVENNMPFSDGDTVFIFNGELHGVRIRETGRIGAEKIYNYIRRFDAGDRLVALTKGVGIITRRTRYVRAMNIVLADTRNAWVSTSYNENPEYFQMSGVSRDGMRIVCSAPFAGESGWQPLANGTTEAIPPLQEARC